MPTQRLIQVLFDELPQQPQEQLQLPVSGRRKSAKWIWGTMAQEPARWNTLGQWASVFAMSERNLTRLVVKETGPRLSSLASSVAINPRRYKR